MALATLDRDTLQTAVVAALWGHGSLDKDTAVRTAAAALRDAGTLDYQRLRRDGAIYADLLAVIESAVKSGALDRPKRGHVRAIRARATDYDIPDWRIALLAVLDDEPIERKDAIRQAAEWARDHFGLHYKRLRTGGHIESGLKSALNSAIRRGEIERIDTTRICKPRPGSR